MFSSFKAKIIVTRSSPTAMNFFLVLMSTSVHSPAFFGPPLLLFSVGPRNKTGHPAHTQKRVKQVPVLSVYEI